MIDKYFKEESRIYDELSKKKPGTDEYEKLLKHQERIHKLRVDAENFDYQAGWEDTKVKLEEAKLEHSKAVDAEKERLDKERIRIEDEKIKLEKERLKVESEKMANTKAAEDRKVTLEEEKFEKEQNKSLAEKFGYGNIITMVGTFGMLGTLLVSEKSGILPNHSLNVIQSFFKFKR